MVQKDMTWEVFDSIVSRLRPGHVSLQGEGEPTLWPHFERAAKSIYKCFPLMTIINGTRVDPELLSKYFVYVGISLDSLDKTAAKDIGRYNLNKVLENIERLIPLMHRRLVIHTTSLGQDIQPLKDYCKQRNLRHAIQPLQKKDDYVKVYPVQWGIRTASINSADSYKCSYLERDRMDFYTVDGELRPCCLMKTPLTVTKEVLLSKLSQGTIPDNCLGCSNIQQNKHTG